MSEIRTKVEAVRRREVVGRMASCPTGDELRDLCQRIGRSKQMTLISKDIQCENLLP